MSPLQQLILLCKLLHSYLLIQIQNKMDILFLIYINNCHATYINILICGYENLLLIIFLLCTCLIVYQVWKCLEIWNKNATHISMRQRVFIRWRDTLFPFPWLLPFYVYYDHAKLHNSYRFQKHHFKFHYTLFCEHFGFCL